MPQPSPENFRMDKRIEPWQMQPGETSEAYHYFTFYRDFGVGRTLKKAAHEFLTKTNREYATMSSADREHTLSELCHNVFEVHSAKNMWIARVRAYDAAMDREIVQARMKGQREAAHQAGQMHNHILTGMLGMVGEYVAKFHSKADSKFREKRLEDMTIGELATITKLIPLHRVTLGMDTMAEAGALNDQVDGRQTRIAPEEAKRIAREAAAEVKAQEPDPDTIVLEPPKE